MDALKCKNYWTMCFLKLEHQFVQTEITIC